MDFKENIAKSKTCVSQILVKTLVLAPKLSMNTSVPVLRDSLERTVTEQIHVFRLLVKTELPVHQTDLLTLVLAGLVGLERTAKLNQSVFQSAHAKMVELAQRHKEDTNVTVVLVGQA